MYMLVVSGVIVCGQAFAGQLSCPPIGDSRQGKYFEVCAVNSRTLGGVYYLDIQVYYGLSDTSNNALKSGVPITFSIQIEVIRNRNWMWDETIASLNQKFRLQYHALTRKYVVTNLNSKARLNYPDKRSAIAAISQLNHLPVIDKKLILGSESYYGRVRSRLVVADLPSPLRLWAYLSSDWRLKSEWYQWPL